MGINKSKNTPKPIKRYTVATLPDPASLNTGTQAEVADCGVLAWRPGGKRLGADRRGRPGHDPEQFGLGQPRHPDAGRLGCLHQHHRPNGQRRSQGPGHHPWESAGQWRGRKSRGPGDPQPGSGDNARMRRADGGTTAACHRQGFRTGLKWTVQSLEEGKRNAERDSRI